MENQRFLLYTALALVLYLIWTSWQQENEITQSSGITETAQVNNSAGGQSELYQNFGVPAPIEQGQAEAYVPAKSIAKSVAATPRVMVQTDVYQMEIDLRGADIHHLELLDYPMSLDEGSQSMILLDDRKKTYIPQSFFVHAKRANGDVSRLAPSPMAVFQATKLKYEMADGVDEMVIPFTWRSENNVVVTKNYRFTRGSYLINVDYTIKNQGNSVWSAVQYRQIRHSYANQDMGFFKLPTYTGAAYFDEKYQKLSFDDMQEETLGKTVNGGWIAMLQHYFFSAWLAEDLESNVVYSQIAKKEVGTDFIIGARSEFIQVAPGQAREIKNRLYVGPKLQKVIEDIHPGLELTTDYGMFTPISKPLFWLLDFINNLVHNWGLSIILVTLLIKILFYRLSATSYKSMAKMRKVQPRFQALRERYADDKQKMNQAVMELYKNEKINPLGGCLPILIQMPVFLSLYWVLIESVELRQAPFMFWIQDLSIKDPTYILPLLMGVSMFIQFKLNPKPPDPMQEKIFMIMPVFMTVFMATFPAGLVLYWFVNNLLSISQQWMITRQYEKAS